MIAQIKNTKPTQIKIAQPLSSLCILANRIPLVRNIAIHLKAPRPSYGHFRTDRIDRSNDGCAVQPTPNEASAHKIQLRIRTETAGEMSVCHPLGRSPGIRNQSHS